MPLSPTDLPDLKVSAEDLLGTVLETVAQPIWIVDPDEVIRFANAAAIAALGYDGAGELDWFLRRDGSIFPVRYVAAPTAMPEGRGGW